MRTRKTAYPANSLITVTAAGRVDLAGTKTTLRNLAGHPDFKAGWQVLFDWRRIRCEMSLTDVYEISKLLSDLDTALPSRKGVAVLVSGGCALDRAKFLELCATNRGVRLAAFDDYDKVSAWLDAPAQGSQQRAPPPQPDRGPSQTGP